MLNCVTSEAGRRIITVHYEVCAEQVDVVDVCSQLKHSQFLPANVESRKRAECEARDVSARPVLEIHVALNNGPYKFLHVVASTERLDWHIPR